MIEISSRPAWAEISAIANPAQIASEPTILQLLARCRPPQQAATGPYLPAQPGTAGQRSLASI